MSDRDNILSFRRFQEYGNEASPPKSQARGPQDVENEPSLDSSVAEEGAAITNAGSNRHMHPAVLSMIGKSQAFAWRELSDERSTQTVQIRLGTARWSAAEHGVPSSGSIVVLNRMADEPVEIVVGGEVIGLGKLVVAHNKLAVEICRVCRRPTQRSA